MNWMVRGSNPGGGEIFCTHQTGPGAQSASYTMGTGSFTGVKQKGHGIDHPPPSSTEVEGRVELYSCSPSGPSKVNFTFILHIKNWLVFLKQNSVK